MLAAEGLFDAERKVHLPFMPKTIGVVTSPTGSVIRDILHRIEDRFPSHVLVWPVLVQGDKAAEQIAGAITGFNQADGFPRPDVLIVARGGGSMEDLWCFNEEIVARAAANSEIPLISAVGHETDWTLIDFVADYRAPTPTGAAEVAVPVREDWLETIADYGLRITRGLRRNVNEKKTALSAARLPRLEGVVAAPRQRLDLAVARLPRPERLFEPLRQRLVLTASNFPSLGRLLDGPKNRLAMVAARLRPEPIKQSAARQAQTLSQISGRTEQAIKRKFEQDRQRLAKAAQLLDAYSYQGVLERGYALVQTESGDVVRSKDKVKAGEGVTLTFADGKRKAVIDGNVTKKAKPKKKIATEKTQQDLF